MWLNSEHITNSALRTYQRSLSGACPQHVVIDGLFNQSKLDQVLEVLQQAGFWRTQNHTYEALYVDSKQWQEAKDEQRFVQRDAWKPATNAKCDSAGNLNIKIAQDFLTYLRGQEFLSVLSRIFNVRLTDKNVAEPKINTNYFRLSPSDFVAEHADDSPGREVCLLLYLNKEWHHHAGGELVFSGKDDNPVMIAPLYNRCVVFDPSSEGSEHWVNRLNAEYADTYRYNVTSWYWSE